ncbi:ARF guanine-nucleotide exchange factor GNOM-like [Punica granatum]|uniref:ARF guanine-nucleotide exchange factor GNOM-like n=1 Tax=Punica granatum TaxID=22663 RepID=A0A6P8E3U0_PUNGR|nr:ARF guanine-nucleotide exchange factor GNOM-like [Punica granatum]
MGCPNRPSGAREVKEGYEDCSFTSSDKHATFACIINSEVGAVLAVMRRNVRWGGHYLSGNDQREHSLIQSLMALRKQIFYWQHQWNDTDPRFYLQPFLDIIQSDETGAPITGVALSAVYKILSVDMIDQYTVNAESALQLVVDAVTSCRFEVTDPASEEVVLMKILQVLLACMKSKASTVLSNQHVCSIVNTCFRIVHQAGTKGELLQRIARNTMHELVRCIFSRLQDFDKTYHPVPSGAITVKQEVGGVHIEDSTGRNQLENGSSISNYDGQLSPGTVTSDAAGVPVTPLPSKTVSRDDDGKDATSSGLHMQKEHYGIPCMVEIFQFLSSLLTAVEHIGMGTRANSIAFDEDVPIFALGLINSALELSGSSLHHHPSLLHLIRDEVFQNFIQFGLSMSPLVLSMVFSIILNLYHHMHTELKLQLEAFFSCVILRLAQGGNGHSYPQEEVAMEALVDFCRQKEFVIDMYVNLDCDVTCSNVFEDIVNLLSKSAIPEDSSLSSMHTLALDGLIAVIKGMTERIGSGSINSKGTLLNSEEHTPIWTVRCDDYSDPNHWVSFVQWRKLLKKSVMAGVDQFNTNPKKGLEFLQQAHLLPDKLEPQSVSCFFRYTPGLDKNLIGDFLGNHDQFCIQTLHAFAGTFDFRGMNLDNALRLFLETFRLPGESQKIQRILEAFSERYYEQSPQILANKDAALLLSYSLILLNTDQHSSQVKRKMTENEFIRNNRLINGGNDLPREYLLDLYHSICNKEICFTDKGAASMEMTSSRWLDLIDKSKKTDPFIVSDCKAYLDRDMFAIVSGPTVAAISVVFELAEEDDVYQTCINGFLDVAKVSACYHFEDVLDDLVVSLCGFTILLNLSSFDEPVLGEDMKARMATEAVFTIANRYGDSIRASWRNILDCILRLHKLGLLPAHMASDAADESEHSANAGNRRSTLSSSPNAQSQKTGSPQGYVGFVSRFSRLFSFDTDEPRSEPTEQQLAAHRQARQIIEKCHIESIFTESKFLQAESLLQLAQALIWASEQAAKQNGSPEDEDTAVFCLELLIAITLNNRDRIGLLWQCVYEHITSIVQSIVMPCALVEKAVFGLLRICQRLLPYKEDLADELLRSLQLVLKLDARVADAYCEQITQEINCLVKSNAVHIRSQMGWRVITSLLSISARHPEAAEAGFDSLFFIMSGGAHLLPVNYLLCMDASRQFAESRVGGAERSLLALDLMAGSLDCLVQWTHEAKKAMEEQDAARFCQDIGEMWLRLVQGLKRVCSDQREEIRNHALLSLQNCLIGADGIDLPHYLWLQCFNSVIFSMLDDLIEITQVRSYKDYRNMEGTLILAVKLLSKAFLQLLHWLSRVETFGQLWVDVLTRMDKYMKVKVRGKKSEKLLELVPELLKNTLLVMKARGILTPRSSTSQGDVLWEVTWTNVNNVDPSLRSEVFSDQELEQQSQQAESGADSISNGTSVSTSG